MSGEEQTVVKATAQIDWRKLLLLSLFVMALPTISAILLDMWLGSLPFVTVMAILICFPTATILVIRTALSEMDRVIAEVTPPPSMEIAVSSDTEATLDADLRVESSPTP